MDSFYFFQRDDEGDDGEPDQEERREYADRGFNNYKKVENRMQGYGEDNSQAGNPPADFLLFIEAKS